VQNQHGVVTRLVEGAPGFVGHANVWQRLPRFKVIGAEVRKEPVAGRIALTPRTGSGRFAGDRANLFVGDKTRRERVTVTLRIHLLNPAGNYAGRADVGNCVAP
jgi:hypothetical protein